MCNEKPPLGLKPEYIWIKHRIQEIDEAVGRYIEAGYKIPFEWLEERNRHIETVCNNKKNVTQEQLRKAMNEIRINYPTCNMTGQRYEFE